MGGLEITPALTFTYEDESFTEGVTRHVDREAALRYARMRYDDPEGDYRSSKTSTICDSKIVEKLLTLGSVTKYEEDSQNIRKFCKTNFYSRKIIPNCSNA